MTSEDNMTSRWQRFKRLLFPFIAGLIIGPFLSAAFHWQVTSGTMRENVQEAIMHQQTEACAYMARQHTEHPEKMGYQARRKLAEQYAKLPWDDTVSYEVRNLCTDMLAETPAAEPKPTN